MSVPPDELIRAWHEAAHGVVARHLGGRVVSLSMEAEEEGLESAAAIEWAAASRGRAAEQSARTALAGPLAELGRFGHDEIVARGDVSAWEGDWREVERCARVLEASEEGRRKRIDRWILEVRAFLADPEIEESIARVADALDAHGCLDEGLFEECFN